jgi:hypothetical protein
MKTNPYLTFKQGDKQLAIFVDQIVTFHAEGDSQTIVFLADGTNRSLDIGFDSFCRMVNYATDDGASPTGGS